MKKERKRDMKNEADNKENQFFENHHRRQGKKTKNIYGVRILKQPRKTSVVHIFHSMVIVFIFFRYE